MQRPMLALASIVVVALSLATAASAASLTPSKASQAVTLQCSDSSSSCEISGTSGTTLNPDGTFSYGFTIPSGHVLVITSATIGVLQSPGPVFVLLNVGPNAVWQLSGTTNSVGNLFADKAFPTGIIVKPGVTIDASGGGLLQIYLTVNGFIASDK